MTYFAGTATTPPVFGKRVPLTFLQSAVKSTEILCDMHETDGLALVWCRASSYVVVLVAAVAVVAVVSSVVVVVCLCCC